MSELFKKIFGFKKTDESTGDYNLNKLDSQSMDMVKGIFDLSNSTVKDFIVPRTDVTFLDINLSKKDLFDILLRDNYSRYPVYENEIDNVIGILYTKDLLHLFIKENMSASNKNNLSIDLFVSRLFEKLEYINKEFLELFVEIKNFLPKDIHSQLTDKDLVKSDTDKGLISTVSNIINYSLKDQFNSMITLRNILDEVNLAQKNFEDKVDYLNAIEDLNKIALNPGILTEEKTKDIISVSQKDLSFNKKIDEFIFLKQRVDSTIGLFSKLKINITDTMSPGEQKDYIKNIIESHRAFFEKEKLDLNDFFMRLIKGSFSIEDIKEFYENCQKQAIKSLVDEYIQSIEDDNISIKDILRNCLFIPEMLGINELLKQMKAKRIHLAVTLDEWGGVSGIVAMEDIIEEIFGQIQDEFDDEVDNILDITEEGQSNKIYLCNARTRLDDINEVLKISLPEKDFESLSGYVFHLFKKIPSEGEKISDGNIDFFIKEIDNHKIKRVKIVVRKEEKDN